MAALAAARAASGKKPANSPAPASSVMAVVAPASPEKIEPTISHTASPLVSAVATPQVVDNLPNYVDNNQMPPPWDDLDFEVQATPPTNRRHKDIQEADYWAEESSPELGLDPVMQTNLVSSSLDAPAFVEEAQVSVLQDLSSSTLAVNVNTDAAKEAVNEVSQQTGKPLKLMPMAEINWDGHWPNLAASLPVRGVAQQLAQQSELRHCGINGNAIQFKLCVPLQTLLSAGSGDKLTSALNERFAEFGREIRIDFEIGAVEQTANAQAVAERAERQVQAEQAIQSDSFVQTLMREFGASILTGSIRPI
jgi:DNA polymerase-3 subunit gamma/tau